MVEFILSNGVYDLDPALPARTSARTLVAPTPTPSAWSRTRFAASVQIAATAADTLPRAPGTARIAACSYTIRANTIGVRRSSAPTASCSGFTAQAAGKDDVADTSATSRSRGRKAAPSSTFSEDIDHRTASER